jgi:hypothetical protein
VEGLLETIVSNHSKFLSIKEPSGIASRMKSNRKVDSSLSDSTPQIDMNLANPTANR